MVFFVVFLIRDMTLDGKIPAGPLAQKWDKHRFDIKLVMELRGTACVAVPKPLERSRHASRPPERERDRSPRAPRHVEPGRADAPPRPGPGSPSYANVPISPSNRNGESWTYVGKQRCKTFEPPGAAPRIICP